MEFIKCDPISQISDDSLIYQLPNDILGEIIYPLPYTQTRLINKNFKNISDDIESTRGASVPINYQNFLNEEFLIDFLNTKPKRLSYMMPDEYLPRQLCSRDGRVYTGIRSPGGGLMRFNISRVITELTTANVIPGPQFVRFILSKHPLHHNLTFVRKKLVATCGSLLHTYNRYYTCCRWDLSYTVLEELGKVGDYSLTILNEGSTVQRQERNLKTVQPWYDGTQNIQTNIDTRPDKPSTPFAFISGVFVGLLFGTFIYNLSSKVVKL
jgi:hypothetical protein